jgi:hypothetical protein
MGGMGNIFGKFVGDAVAEGIGDPYDIVRARDLYLTPDLRFALVAASGPDGFSPITGAVLRESSIQKAAEFVNAPPGPGFQGHCGRWIGGIVSRWNRLVPLTERPPMDEAQMSAFFNEYLQKAGLSWRGARDFWVALPSNGVVGLRARRPAQLEAVRDPLTRTHPRRARSGKPKWSPDRHHHHSRRSRGRPFCN